CRRSDWHSALNHSHLSTSRSAFHTLLAMRPCGPRMATVAPILSSANHASRMRLAQVSGHGHFSRPHNHFIPYVMKRRNMFGCNSAQHGSTYCEISRKVGALTLSRMLRYQRTLGGYRPESATHSAFS